MMLKLFKKIDYTKWIMYFVGIQILTIGVAFFNESLFGATAFDNGFISLAKHTSISIAILMNVFAVVVLIITGITIKKLPKIETFITTFIISGSLNIWLIVFEGNLSGNKIVLFIIGLILHTFGIALYLASDGLPTAVDYFMLTFCKKFNIKVMYFRIMLDVFGFILTIVAKGPIAIGTIVLLFLVGPMIQFFMKNIMKFRLKFERDILKK